ncbi:MAG: transporter [Chitinophagaceae bacterium]|nr:transporter [Oligoflexus sp.]
MPFSSVLIFTLSTLLSVVLASEARSAPHDKSRYSLFNPTPTDQMRELSSDRPDSTEGAITIDAGHFQLESDLYNRTFRASKNGDREATTQIFSSNIRTGLTDNLEFDLIVAPYFKDETRTSGVTDDIQGSGDTTLRLKLNLLGNNGAALSIGLIPFVKMPTAAEGLGNKKVEGGLILPVGYDFPNDWELGAMLEVDASKNEDSDGFHMEWITSITCAHPIIGDFSGYVEIYSGSSSEAHSTWKATFDTGLTYGLDPNVQLDIGTKLGLTRAADDMSPFLGFTARL